MKTNEPRPVRIANALYCAALNFYPAEFHREFGRPMAQFFRTQSRDAWRRGPLPFLQACLSVALDAAKTIPQQRWSHARRFMNQFYRQMPSRHPNLFSLALGALTFFFLVTTVAVVTANMPRTFSSSARVSVEPMASGDNAASNSGAAGAYDPYAIQTQFERIKSRQVLEQVIDELGLMKSLSERFGVSLKKSEAVLLLGKHVQLRQSRNTSLIEVSVFHPDPRAAAEIANKITQVFAAQSAKAAAGNLKVAIVDQAQPAPRAVRPNVPLNIALGGAASAIAAISLALLVRLILFFRAPKPPPLPARA